jgi:hypothetical protein
MKPTMVRLGPVTLQTGQSAGDVARPVVYRLPALSPVRPSIASGVIAWVVNVALRGNRPRSSSAIAKVDSAASAAAQLAAMSLVFFMDSSLAASLPRSSGAV